MELDRQDLDVLANDPLVIRLFNILLIRRLKLSLFFVKSEIISDICPCVSFIKTVLVFYFIFQTPKIRTFEAYTLFPDTTFLPPIEREKRGGYRLF